jgi:adenine-specific DNA-methyltransferase
MREILLKRQIESIVLLPFDVFADAYVDTTVFVFAAGEAEHRHKVKTYVFRKREKLKSIDLTDQQYSQVNQNDWIESEGHKFVLSPETIQLNISLKKRTTICFNDVIQMKRGVLFDKVLLTGGKTSSNSFRYFEGDVYRYNINSKLPNWIEFDDRMSERPKEIIWFTGERLLLRRLVNRKQRLMATLAADTFITNKNLYSILSRDTLNLLPMLGILNSKLISYLYINQVTQATKDDFPQVTIKDLLSLPFPKLERKNKQNKMVSLVERMLDLHKRLGVTKVPAEKTRLQREIDSTDSQIDRLVYELYGLTEEEISIVEGG